MDIADKLCQTSMQLKNRRCLNLHVQKSSWYFFGDQVCHAGPKVWNFLRWKNAHFRRPKISWDFSLPTWRWGFRGGVWCCGLLVMKKGSFGRQYRYIYIYTYCWWKKSCTSWEVVYPIIYKVSSMAGGAGFLPSTVCIYIYIYTYVMECLLVARWWFFNESSELEESYIYIHYIHMITYDTQTRSFWQRYKPEQLSEMYRWSP